MDRKWLVEGLQALAALPWVEGRVGPERRGAERREGSLGHWPLARAGWHFLFAKTTVASLHDLSQLSLAEGQQGLESGA